jgi:hypothetical protein
MSNISCHIYLQTNRKTCVAKIDFKQYACQSALAFNENKYALIIHLYTLIIKTGNFQGFRIWVIWKRPKF